MQKSLLFLSFIFPAHLFAQFTAPQKANIIFDIALETTWLADSSWQTYGIALWDNSDSLYNQFLDFKQSGRLLHQKPLAIFSIQNFDFFKDTSTFDSIHLLYLSPKYSNLSDTIAKLIRGHNILLITDNAPKLNNSMVNLLNNSDKYYEINYLNTQQQGLKFSEDILVLGGNEDLLRQMYVDSMRVLRTERQQVLYKIYQIQDRNQRLQLKEEQIVKRQKELDSITAIVSILSDRIKNERHQLFQNEKEVSKQRKIINKQRAIYQLQLTKIDSINQRLKQKEQLIKEKKKQIKNVNQQLSKDIKRIQSQSDYIKLGFLIFIILLFILYYFFQRAKRAKEIEVQNKKIKLKNEEIEQKNSALQDKQEIINQKNSQLQLFNKNLTDSINYALRIQLALLPSTDITENNFEDYFIFFRPKEIVSGDFYWFRQKKDKIIVAAADCTGHGVPGAFMSMLGMTFLSEITNNDIFEPQIILDSLRKKIIDALVRKKMTTTVKDGIDIALAIIDKKTQIIEFAGAYNPLIFVSKNQNNKFNLLEIKADKMPVGRFLRDSELKHFTKKEIKYSAGDRIYMFSDGYKDQFGGGRNKKITKRRFYDLILSIQDKTMQQQKNEIETFLYKWMQQSNQDQVDDIIILGITL